MDKVKKLPAEIKTLWRFKAIVELVLMLLVAVGIFIWRHFAPQNMQKGLLTTGMIVLAIAILLFIFELALVAYRWNFWTYFIDDRQVELHHGFFFRKQIVIPIARVQNVTLKQGPILKWKNLQKVIIVTAAGSEDIAGLRNQDADELKELIMKLAKEARNDI